MNKSDLIMAVAKKAKIPKATAGAAIDAAFNGIRDGLARGKSIVLVGFGTFVVSKRSARMGRNPRTKEPIRIPASRVPRFRAGKALKSAVKRGK
jgi:DNA-binding protein HU-beta